MNTNRMRQQERQIKVTTVQTINETKITHLDDGDESSSESDNRDGFPIYTVTTTTTFGTNHPQLPIAVSSATDLNRFPPSIAKPQKCKHRAPITATTITTDESTKDGNSAPVVTESHQPREDSQSPESPEWLPENVTAEENDVSPVQITSPTALVCASQKLRLLIEAINNGTNTSKTAVINSLTYALSVLDHNYEAKTKPSAELTRALSRASSIDNLVREWLTDTFTVRNMQYSLRRGTAKNIDDAETDEDLGLKSALQKLKIKDMAERFLRVVYRISIPDDLRPLLKRIYYWDFDVFELHRLSGGHSLRFICLEALSHFGVCDRFKLRRIILERFLTRLEEGYCVNRNPYHNALHGADVIQGTVFYLSVTNLSAWLSDLDIFTTVIAAAIHDFEHTGTTNNFHINTKSNLALFYNDRSVLENYHISAVFRFMASDPDNLDIFTGLTAQQYKDMRALLIEIVLNTDMQFHTTQIKSMRSTLNSFDEDNSSVTIDKAKVLSLIVHSADVSHPGRAWPLHFRWSKMLCQEFFNQGDREKTLGLSISPLCDRVTTKVASSQIGFIDFVVLPTFELAIDTSERVLNALFLENKETNKTQAIASQDEYISEEAETGQPCDFVPFKWDGRRNTLQIHRFFRDNIEENRAMWRKYSENETNDFENFERDAVVELGWNFPEEDQEEAEKGSPPAVVIEEGAKRAFPENQAAAEGQEPPETPSSSSSKRKEKGNKSETPKEREARKLRKKIERYQQKLKDIDNAAEDEDEGEEQHRSSKTRRHHHRHRHSGKLQDGQSDSQGSDVLLPSVEFGTGFQQKYFSIAHRDEEEL